jgi:dihydroorotase
MAKYLIKNAVIVNEGHRFKGDVLINNDIIDRIWEGSAARDAGNASVLDAGDKILMPGIIDDHVHFREPGMTHKADIASESKAAVAGGVTSYMDMPNTIPPATTVELLNEKFALAEKGSLANYSFYIGATDANIKELLKTNPREVCGIKVFLGSSTGNMLVNNTTLSNIFSESPVLIAAHCEDEETIMNNLSKYKAKHKENIDISFHPLIRSAEACYKSSSLAVEMALKYNARLHVLHISTERELGLFSSGGSAGDKNITCEVCIHHLWFDDNDYNKYGTGIKCNPAIKTAGDREALLKGLLAGKIDLIGTDHAPHTIDEKNNPYLKAPSGIPMIQHSLVAMLEFYHRGMITLEEIVSKMCHAPADMFRIDRRGYIREGYFADLVLVDLNQEWEVKPDNILYKCKWSPLENTVFHSAVSHTFVNGCLVYDKGNITGSSCGRRLSFNR